MDNKKCQKELEIFTITAEKPRMESVSPKKTFWSIDREMLRFKMHFFLFIGALGTSLPYMAVFAKIRVNISATSLAAILTTQQFLFIFTKPMFGYIADYFNKLKVVIASLAVIQGIFLFLLLPIPSIEKQDQVFHKSHYCETTSLDFMKSNSLDNFTIYDRCRLQLKCNGTLLPEGIENQASEISKPCSFSTLNNLESDNNSVQVIATCLENHLDFSTPTNLDSENKNYNWYDKCVLSVGDFTNESSSPNNKVAYESFTSEISFYSVNGTGCPTINNLIKTNESGEKISNGLKFGSCCRNIDGQNISCLDVHNQSMETETKLSNKSDFKTYQFWLFALLLTIGMACINALFTLSDTACCDSVQKSGADFGRQRLWGALGWGAMGPVGGFLNDYTGDYLASWILMGAMSAAALWNLRSLELVKPQFSQNILKDVGTVLKSKEFLAFGLSTMMNGMGAGIMWFYFFWFLTTLGGSELLCGFTQSVECFVGEVPFMFFSGWMIKKVGHFNVLSMSLLAYSARFLWYSRVHNPWLVLPLEIMHGFTYGFFYAGVASYAKASAKPGTEATTQAILFTAHEGLGAGLGCILAGLGFDHFGGHSTFFYAGLFFGCGALINIFFTLSLGKCRGAVKATSDNGT